MVRRAALCRSGADPQRLTLDPVRVISRPLGYYVVCNAVTFGVYAWLIGRHGYRIASSHGLQFLVKPASQRHRSGGAEFKLPVVFLQCVGAMEMIADRAAASASVSASTLRFCGGCPSRTAASSSCSSPASRSRSGIRASSRRPASTSTPTRSRLSATATASARRPSSRTVTAPWSTAGSCATTPSSARATCSSIRSRSACGRCAGAGDGLS